MYCAIIGDIIHSRNLAPEERYALQETLRAELEACNEAYGDAIAARFLITLGDEFQGLLHVAWPSVPVIRRLLRALWPIGVRFGIGWGEMYTRIDPAQAIGADGEAFHRARAAIEIEKARKTAHFPVTFRTGAGDEPLLDGLCGLLDAVSSSWSAKQREAVFMMESLGGTQKEAAGLAGRTASSMSTLLSNANYKEYDAALRQLETYLLKAYGGQEERV